MMIRGLELVGIGMKLVSYNGCISSVMSDTGVIF